jgi:hypothetical protein
MQVYTVVIIYGSSIFIPIQGLKEALVLHLLIALFQSLGSDNSLAKIMLSFFFRLLFLGQLANQKALLVVILHKMYPKKTMIHCYIFISISYNFTCTFIWCHLEIISY